MGVGSGTDALNVALRAFGVGVGDLVATVSHTAVATVAAIEMAGATPVLVDIDPATFAMDPGALEAVLKTTTVRAVIPVHLYGQPADMAAINEISRRHGAVVIEDCAQSHGHATGMLSDAAAFSFYPTKNLGALGDGGCVVTSDAKIAERCRMIREYGWRNRYVSEIAGVNSRLDEMQAAILRVKLRYLDVANAKRAAIAAVYREMLELPDADAGHVYHQFVIRTKRRDALRAFLTENGVGTLIHYPVPVHLQPAYSGRLAAGALGQTEAAAREVLSLPMYPELPLESAQVVAAQIQMFLG
jgi:dTDP-4-amino-4,6-dideoxygalactose transaminase